MVMNGWWNHHFWTLNVDIMHKTRPTRIPDWNEAFIGTRFVSKCWYLQCHRNMHGFSDRWDHHGRCLRVRNDSSQPWDLMIAHDMLKLQGLTSDRMPSATLPIQLTVTVFTTATRNHGWQCCLQGAGVTLAPVGLCNELVMFKDASETTSDD